MIVAIGDIVTVRKPHPCGSKDWKVIRTGADYKLECTGCGRIVLVTGDKLHKMMYRLNGEKPV